jgi:GMP synthase-like glutamine amidotransferase
MLRAAHEAGVPVLGICFGGQALAVALGGGVARATRWEIGWTVIRPVDEAAAEVVGAGPWFQFHQDAMLPPAGARSLADNAVCSQAWSLGRSLAVQFHPEVTVSVLDMWFANGGTHPVRANGLDPERVRDSLVEHEDAARDRTATLVNAYLDRVATHAR